MEFEKSQDRVSKASSRSSKKKDKSAVLQINDSDDISMSQLELLANKKKMNKKSEELSIELESKSEVKSKSKSKSEVKKTVKQVTASSDTSSIDSEKYKRDRRKISKENKNESIRKEKNDILFKLYSVIEKSGGRWSSKMTMENSLDEIRGEFTRIKATLDNENMVKFCKHGLVMGIKGVEMLNNSYDPLGVDLDGWGEAMSFNMSTTEYDEVLSELCDKYKGAGSMSPEVKLLVMIVMSGAMFSFSKKAAKDPSTLTNLMNSFMSKKQNTKNSPVADFNIEQQRRQENQLKTQQMQEQQMQQQQQMHQQQMYQQQMQQQQMQQQQMQQQQMYQQQMYQQQMQENASDDSDDVPSKLRGPVFDTPDSINIENIIKTMKENKKQKSKKSEIDIEKILNETDSGDEVVKDIPTPKPRGKGRQPKKTKVVKNQ
jgi:Family of unknown function (DUF5767)